MADKTLESLVPPLDLCYRLYPQDFSDSIFVWAIGPNGNRILVQRNYHVLLNNEQVVLHYEGIAAPTYEEIMNAIRKLKCERLICSMQPVGWSVVCWLNGECHIEIDRRAVLAALKVWFELKGIKYDAR